jgi:hypothetical protein
MSFSDSTNLIAHTLRGIKNLFQGIKERNKKING